MRMRWLLLVCMTVLCLAGCGSGKTVDKDEQVVELIMALPVKNMGMEKAIEAFNRANEKYVITTTYPDSFEELATYTQKLQMEISAGKGPDLLADSLIGDIDGYIRNGALGRIDASELGNIQLIRPIQETIEQKGFVYGVPYDFSIYAVAYPESIVGEKKSVNIDELMGWMEETGRDTLQKWVSAYEIIFRYGLWDATNIEYIDWKSQTSHLREEPFLKLIRFAKQYGTQSDDKGLVVSPTFSIDSFTGFHNIFDEASEKIMFLGYPHREGNGIYIETRDLYINQNSQNREGAVAFLKYLLSEECQRNYMTCDDFMPMGEVGELIYVDSCKFPVNQTVLAEVCKREEQKQETVVHGNEIEYVNKYKDGEFEEFYFMIEHLELPMRNTVVENILYEELGAYFTGEISAESAAERMHNRVQLYLDE